MPEVRIQVDVDAAGHYRFRVRNGAREIATDVDPWLATSFYEDLRLLRWKSVVSKIPEMYFSVMSGTGSRA